MPRRCRLDETTALGYGGLLVLAAEIVFADTWRIGGAPGGRRAHARAERAADLLDHFGRLALRVQRCSRPPGKAPWPPHRLDRNALVFLGDRREARNLPIFLGQYLADQIVSRVTPEDICGWPPARKENSAC